MTWVRCHRPDGRVVIAGGGLAAQRAVETLRRNGYDDAIQLISDEPDAPYDRPPLSKDFLAGALGEQAPRFRGDQWYADRDVQLRLGEPVAGLDAPGRQLLLASGERLPFSQLLIATGGAPRHLPGTAGLANVHHLRGLPDARRLRDAIASADHVAVIGAGFIGQEVASSARAASCSQTA